MVGLAPDRNGPAHKLDNRWFVEVGSHAATLRERVRDELKSKAIYAIGQGGGRFYDPSEPLFGHQVHMSFPSASYDIAVSVRVRGVISGVD